MTTRIDTFCKYHIGDNMAHLHYVRWLSCQFPEFEFFHYVEPCYLEQLREMVEDIPAIKILPMSQKTEGAIDVWKNADGFWDSQPDNYHYAPVTPKVFDFHGRRMLGDIVPNFPRDPVALLFDYPKLKNDNFLCGYDPDFLIINSRPCSGQFLAYNSLDYLDPLIESVRKGGWRVVVTQKTNVHVPCTQDFGLSITQIGQLSRRVRYIVMVGTGPSWPTFNIWNCNSVKLRIVLLGREVLNIAPNTHHATNIEQATEVLRCQKLI